MNQFYLLVKNSPKRIQSSFLELRKYAKLHIFKSSGKRETGSGQDRRNSTSLISTLREVDRHQ